VQCTPYLSSNTIFSDNHEIIIIHIKKLFSCCQSSFSKKANVKADIPQLHLWNSFVPETSFIKGLGPHGEHHVPWKTASYLVWWFYVTSNKTNQSTTCLFWSVEIEYIYTWINCPLQLFIRNKLQNEVACTRYLFQEQV